MGVVKCRMCGSMTFTGETPRGDLGTTLKCSECGELHDVSPAAARDTFAARADEAIQQLIRESYGDPPPTRRTVLARVAPGPLDATATAARVAPAQPDPAPAPTRVVRCAPLHMHRCPTCHTNETCDQDCTISIVPAHLAFTPTRQAVTVISAVGAFSLCAACKAAAVVPKARPLESFWAIPDACIALVTELATKFVGVRIIDSDGRGVAVCGYCRGERIVKEDGGFDDFEHYPRASPPARAQPSPAPPRPLSKSRAPPEGMQADAGRSARARPPVKSSRHPIGVAASHPPDATPAEQLPTPTLRALRVAMDGTRLLYKTPVPGPVWGHLSISDTFQVDLPGEPILFERQGRIDAEAPTIKWIAREGGAWLRMYRADHANELTGNYPVELQIHGLACNSARDGLAAIERVREGVERFVWTERPPEPGMGMTDVAIDMLVTYTRCHQRRFRVACRHWRRKETFSTARRRLRAGLARVQARSRAKASAWIELEVFRSGHGDRIGQMYSTRARKDSLRLLTETRGRHITGRTMYLGKDPQLKIYEKDRHKSRDLPLAQTRWREAGWNGNERVIRIETSVTRNWLAKNQIVSRPALGTLLALRQRRPWIFAPVKASTETLQRLAGPAGLPWGQIVEWLPTMTHELLGRFRMTDRHSTIKRISDRPSSPLWMAAHEGVERWNRRLRDEYGVAPEDWATGEIMALARRYSKDRAEKRLEKAIVDWHTHVAHEKHDVSSAAAVSVVNEHLVHGETRTPIDVLNKARDLRVKRLNLRPSEWGYAGKPIEPGESPQDVTRALERSRALELLLPVLQTLDGTPAGDLVAKAMREIEFGAAAAPPPLDVAANDPQPDADPPVKKIPRGGTMDVPEYPPDPWKGRKR